MKLEWSETYSVGSEMLDSQHKKWIDLYNRLDSLMRGESSEDLQNAKAEVLHEMSEYVDYHFRSEEEYMRTIGYPGVDKHWRMHKDFRSRIYQICRDHEDGLIVLNSEIMDTIRRWLVDHIVKQDVKIMDYLRKSERDKR